MVQAFQGPSTLQNCCKCRPNGIVVLSRGLGTSTRGEASRRRRQGANRLKIHAASLAFGFGGNNGPWVGTMSTAAPSEGEKGSSEGQHGEIESQSEPKPFKSIDPSASGEDITVIHSPDEFEDLKSSHPDQLICLMCKALGCRPCKMFARKYQRVAAANSDSIFLEVTGDETTDLRKLMITMGIRATPTFKFFSGGECILTHVGIDETKLRNAILKCQAIRAGTDEPEEAKT